MNRSINGDGSKNYQQNKCEVTLLFFLRVVNLFFFYWQKII